MASSSHRDTRRHGETRPEQVGPLLFHDGSAPMTDLSERRHFERSKKSVETTPSRFISLAPKDGQNNVRPEGIQRVPQPNRVIKQVRYPTPYVNPKAGEEYSTDNLLGTKIKQYDAKTGELQERKSNSLTLEQQFGRKRSGYDLSKKRNGINVVIPGDKLYSIVELSTPDFYHKGGLVPGSSNTLRPTDAFLVQAKCNEMQSKIKKPSSYETLQRVRQLLGEMDGVRSLTQSKESVSSWETITGMHTWAEKKNNITL